MSNGIDESPLLTQEGLSFEREALIF